MGGLNQRKAGTPYTVFGMSASGNCYKVRLVLENLGLPYRWREIDIMRGESRTPEFLARNPNGRVPVLQIGPGNYLPESNAILCYLADATPLWPADRLQRAQVLQWLFFEQYSHEPYIAVARFIRAFLPAGHERNADLPRLHERGYQALDLRERHLRRNRFLAGKRYTIADIALFAYTHVAADGGFTLARHGAVTDWLARVRTQPGFVPMQGK